MDYKCNKEGEIATLQSEVRSIFRITEKNKSDIKELNKIYDLIKDLTISVSILAEQMKRNTEDLSEVKGDLDDMKRQSQEDYKYYKRLVIGGIIMGVIGFVMGQLL